MPLSSKGSRLVPRPPVEHCGLATVDAIFIHEVPDRRIFDPETPARRGYPDPLVVIDESFLRHAGEQPRTLRAVHGLRGFPRRQARERLPIHFEHALRCPVCIIEDRVLAGVVRHDAERRLVEAATRVLGTLPGLHEVPTRQPPEAVYQQLRMLAQETVFATGFFHDG